VYFAFTDEQRALAETVRDVLADQFDLSAVHQAYDDPDGDGTPPAVWRAASEQGWLAVCVPEKYDGLALGLLDAAAIARAWGAGCGVGPWLPALLGAEAVRLAGDDAQQGAWLPQAASGQVRLVPALQAGGSAWDAAGADVTANGDRLTGSTAPVEYAHVADRLVVAALEGGEVGLWLVDPSSDTVTIGRQDALDRSTRLSTVTLDGSPAERLTHGSAVVVADLLDRAAVLTANDLVGVAREALSRTVAYGRQREQFGRPVGSFQAIKHHLADLHVGVTMAEHTAMYAAHAVDAALPDARLAVSVAKAKASDVGRDTTAAMIQYHGGIGYTWEHEAHLFFKRAKRLEYAYGDAAAHRERIARLVVDRTRASMSTGDEAEWAR
jgi:alkylation response protein AidB-like acyl-CoA dehydrogenase